MNTEKSTYVAALKSNGKTTPLTGEAQDEGFRQAIAAAYVAMGINPRKGVNWTHAAYNSQQQLAGHTAYDECYAAYVAAWELAHPWPTQEDPILPGWDAYMSARTAI